MDMHLPVLLTAGILFIGLFVLGYIGIRTKIPGIILYILLGIAIGGLLTDDHLLQLAGEIGIVILFFMLGMEFPIKRLTGIAKKVAPAGMLDVVLSLGVSMLICLGFGLDWTTSFLIGGIVYATSSSITAKLLESTKRMANTESEFVLALLIFEDLVAPIAVAVLVGLTTGEELTLVMFAWLVIKIILLTAGAVVLGRLMFARLSSFFERYLDEDFFILILIGIALGYGGLAVYLNLSEVLGAFLAGIILAEVKKTEQLEQMVLPIRDIMLPIFFLYFGTTISLAGELPYIGLLITLFFWSIAAKILTGSIGGRWYGLSHKVALRSGFSLTQRGEFSVIIAALAVGAFKLFSGIFILASATAGIVLFLLAPKLTELIFGKKRPKRKYKLPESSTEEG